MVELPLTRALTEPALSLQPPPTNVSVGPPENSLKAAMLNVTTTHLPISVPIPPPIVKSSFDPSTLGILSAIQGMISEALRPLASQVSVISSRCNAIQSRQATNTADPHYSPSAPATLWAPNPTAWTQPEVSQQNSLPTYLDQPHVDYDYNMRQQDDDYDYVPPIHPDLLLVPEDVEHYYRRLYKIHPDTTLTTSQGSELHQFQDDVETYCMEWLSVDTGPLPWSD